MRVLGDSLEFRGGIRRVQRKETLFSDSHPKWESATWSRLEYCTTRVRAHAGGEALTRPQQLQEFVVVPFFPLSVAPWEKCIVDAASELDKRFFDAHAELLLYSRPFFHGEIFGEH